MPCVRPSGPRHRPTSAEVSLTRVSIHHTRVTEPGCTRIGPLVDEQHREHVHGHVTDAVDRGARVLVGSARRSGPGPTTRPPS
ncbi:aldehyde dehydrogenase family protein [Mycolicibacterium obuense]|uniref:aldehyde dehydrogenase family protein n=1 Tax=Mycolicibacterium obuense TaxID=1807 RepID=UPI001F461C4F|nr:aldehyde dehydrogenase family protein [Mycolicibacterium obuense]